jgi:alpha-mannosidase
MPSSDLTSTQLTAISNALQRLRNLTQQDLQNNWHQSPEYLGQASQPTGFARWQHWPIAPLNNRQHIAWQRGRQCLWLHQRMTWPQHLNGYPIQGLSAKLALRWWAESAEIYVNDTLVQVGDLFDCWTRITLTDHLIPGQSVDVSLKLISPGHDDGALVTSRLILEAEDPSGPEPGFVADELAVLKTYLSHLAPHHLNNLFDALELIPWHQVGQLATFNRTLVQLRQSLQDLSPWLKTRTIHCLGHAHLDLAWLWPVADTWKAARSTFESVLKLQQEFPELTFSHSSPALFDWLEHHHPGLFQAIQQKVKTGSWAMDAGLWVEPDLNLPGGEAIARQILYGQLYCLEKFGSPSPMAWLPDSFGFSWQLPQLLSLGHIKFFATQKLRWNDTNNFPYHMFNWQGLNGTQITAVTLPPIGTDIDPIAMADYACEWEIQTGFQECLWLPGVGNHGGGPTRDMLVKARRWARSPFFPNLTFSHAVPLVEKLLQQAQENPTPVTLSRPPIAQNQLSDPPEQATTNHNGLPTWQDELYLELHRGCYTTHADQKFYNRRCEDSLYQAELFASLATLQGLRPYPKAELESAWKQVLFNQFHDILPGSSIPEVFVEANRNWQMALDTGNKIFQQSLNAIASIITIPPYPEQLAIPVILFNPLNWTRSEVISLSLPQEYASVSTWQAQTADGEHLATQLKIDTENGKHSTLLLFVPDIPSVGYLLIWLIPIAEETAAIAPPEQWVLENQILRATISPTTGTITSLLHKPSGKETFKNPGNELQAFEDKGQYWDAWNIVPDYQNHPLKNFRLQSIQWLDYGTIRRTIRVVKTFNQSTFIQDYTLDHQSPCLDIHTQVDWHETQVLIKTAFPLSISAPYATYEIPYGAIQRTTNQNSCDSARWEVPALRWADLSQSNFGVSILTDYKHGFDATPNQLRLTLLKAPLWPDPKADRGTHFCRYSVYPHASGWQTAHTVRQAHNTNFPIQPYFPNQSAVNETNYEPGSTTKTALPNSMSFLNLGDNTLVMSTVKQKEGTTAQFILRCYESTGTKSNITFSSPLSIQLLGTADILEQTYPSLCNTSDERQSPHYSTQEVHPWQVATFVICSNKTLGE